MGKKRDCAQTRAQHPTQARDSFQSEVTEVTHPQGSHRFEDVILVMGETAVQPELVRAVLDIGDKARRRITAGAEVLRQRRELRPQREFANSHRAHGASGR